MATSNEGLSFRCKRALIIGNNNYSQPESKLRHCINDANDLSKLLSAINFEVTTGYDLTHTQMIDTVNSFGKSIVDGDLVMFYFSGHGYQVKDENYLMPVNDDEIETEDDVETHALGVERLLKRLADKNSSYATIFVLDYCLQYCPRNIQKKEEPVTMSGMQQQPSVIPFQLNQQSDTCQIHTTTFTQSQIDSFTSKCRLFLLTLLRLTEKQAPEKLPIVRSCVQDLLVWK
ncbi:unnamed protein product [Rotaria sp. Silwood1]|nr:unnamed protein product [Rotaria sp. Silwood1]